MSANVSVNASANVSIVKEYMLIFIIQLKITDTKGDSESDLEVLLEGYYDPEEKEIHETNVVY